MQFLQLHVQFLGLVLHRFDLPLNGHRTVAHGRHPLAVVVVDGPQLFHGKATISALDRFVLQETLFLVLQQSDPRAFVLDPAFDLLDALLQRFDRRVYRAVTHPVPTDV